MANRYPISRRDWLRMTSLGLAGASLSGWFPALAAEGAKDPGRKRSCILLWMPGGPSQMDTFDLKPDHENGGEFKPIDTSVSGIQISEHLPKLAQQMEHLAIIRSMKTQEGDHTRATHHLKTGYLPQGPVKYPSMGSLISQELVRSDAELPGYVSIAPVRFLNYDSPGFLGPQRAPLVVGENASPGVPQQAGEGESKFGPPLSVKDIRWPEGLDSERIDARLSLLNDMESRFAAQRPGLSVRSHQSAYEQAVRMVRSTAVEAFNLDQEPDALRERYGANRFGQSCLLARRLVERGVPFIEIALSDVPGESVFGWDTHLNNFSAVKSLSGVLDSGWATLLDDLKDRGLLDSTMVVWMGEFGRTPRINTSGGRDHFPNAWTTVLSGGGVRGGTVYGKTSADGMEVAENPVKVNELMATICTGLGIDPYKSNMSNVGRPIRIVDLDVEPVREVLL